MSNWWVSAVFWLEGHSRWNQLKVLGGSSLVRMSVLMPAFGYMLLLNDKIHEYLTIRYDGWLLNFLPGTWRIWLLFYGSFFLAAATIIYSLFCPPEIKRYSSSFEMADGETEHQMNMGQYGMVRDYVKQLYRKRPSWVIPITDPADLNFDVGPEIYSNPKSQLSKFLVHQYTLRNIDRRGLRIFLFLLFVLGLLILLS